MTTITLSETGTLQLPPNIMHFFGLTKGTEFEVIPSKKGITLESKINTPSEAQKQRLIAKKLFLQPSYVALTVTVEFFWVMNKAYQLLKEDIVNILSKLQKLPTIELKERELVHLAINLYSQGMDFANAIHLLKTQHCDNFYTFDQKFINKSKSLSPHLTAKKPL